MKRVALHRPQRRLSFTERAGARRQCLSWEQLPGQVGLLAALHVAVHSRESAAHTDLGVTATLASR